MLNLQCLQFSVSCIRRDSWALGFSIFCFQKIDSATLEVWCNKLSYVQGNVWCWQTKFVYDPVFVVALQHCAPLQKYQAVATHTDLVPPSTSQNCHKPAQHHQVTNKVCLGPCLSGGLATLCTSAKRASFHPTKREVAKIIFLPSLLPPSWDLPTTS